MDKTSPQHGWRGRLKDLLARHTVWLNDMGFPSDWENRPIWQ